jgi:hypothetical protein
MFSSHNKLTQQININLMVRTSLGHAYPIPEHTDKTMEVGRGVLNALIHLEKAKETLNNQSQERNN